MTTTSNNLTRAEAAGRAGVLADVSYELDLDLRGDADTFVSETVVRFTYDADAAAGGADGRDGGTFLDLTALSVERVVVNGDEVTAEFNGDRLQLTGLAAGANEVRVVATCEYSKAGTGLHKFVDPVDGLVYLHTQFEPFDAHRAFACFDQPDLKATFAITVQAPEGWVVVSNEAPSSKPADDGAGAWVFPATPVLSTYLVAVVAGHYVGVFDTHGDIELGLWSRRSLAEYVDPEEFFLVTKQGFDHFAELFGMPYPFKKYDQLFCPEFNAGAMENPGCVTFTEFYIFRSRVTDVFREGRAGTILHEMAHMWFGDLVTMRWWDDLWLNESFATYEGNRAVAEATRFSSTWARFAAGKANTYAADQLPSTHPISADIVDTEAVRLHFDGITYGKGASVMKQLAAWVGQDAFDEGIRAYFAAHSWGNASLDDFLAALAKASGRDLGAWSREWLETAGVNTLRPVVELGDDGRYTSVVIEQAAPDEHPTLRSHRVTVGVFDLDGDGRLARRRSVALDVSGERTPVTELAGETAGALLVVNENDDAYARIRLDPKSTEALVAGLSSLDDPVTRAVCWSAAWDMVRDAELAASAFVDLVVRHVLSEDDLGSVQRLVGQASAAVEAFGAPAKRKAARARLATLARQQMDAAEPGSEAQLVWARFWLGFDESEAAQADKRALLDGRLEIEGLAVDLDLRWQIVGSLVSEGAAGVELVDAEVERDPTDIGQRRGVAISGARPDAEAKEAAWVRATTSVDEPLHTRRAAGGGMWQTDQEELLRPYVGRYVEELPGWFEAFEPDVALSLTGALSPGLLREQATVDALRGLLDGGTLPASARRVLGDMVDSIERALRAQAIDA